MSPSPRWQSILPAGDRGAAALSPAAEPRVPTNARPVFTARGDRPSLAATPQRLPKQPRIQPDGAVAGLASHDAAGVPWAPAPVFELSADPADADWEDLTVTVMAVRPPANGVWGGVPVKREPASPSPRSPSPVSPTEASRPSGLTDRSVSVPSPRDPPSPAAVAVVVKVERPSPAREAGHAPAMPSLNGATTALRTLSDDPAISMDLEQDQEQPMETDLDGHVSSQPPAGRHATARHEDRESNGIAEAREVLGTPATVNADADAEIPSESTPSPLDGSSSLQSQPVPGYPVPPGLDSRVSSDAGIHVDYHLGTRRSIDATGAAATRPEAAPAAATTRGMRHSRTPSLETTSYTPTTSPPPPLSRSQPLSSAAAAAAAETTVVTTTAAAAVLTSTTAAVAVMTTATATAAIATAHSATAFAAPHDAASDAAAATPMATGTPGATINAAAMDAVMSRQGAASDTGHPRVGGLAVASTPERRDPGVRPALTTRAVLAAAPPGAPSAPAALASAATRTAATMHAAVARTTTTTTTSAFHSSLSPTPPPISPPPPHGLSVALGVASAPSVPATAATAGDSDLSLPSTPPRPPRETSFADADVVLTHADARPATPTTPSQGAGRRGHAPLSGPARATTPTHRRPVATQPSAASTSWHAMAQEVTFAAASASPSTLTLGRGRALPGPGTVAFGSSSANGRAPLPPPPAPVVPHAPGLTKPGLTTAARLASASKRSSSSSSLAAVATAAPPLSLPSLARVKRPAPAAGPSPAASLSPARSPAPAAPAGLPPSVGEAGAETVAASASRDIRLPKRAKRSHPSHRAKNRSAASISRGGVMRESRGTRSADGS